MFALIYLLIIFSFSLLFCFAFQFSVLLIESNQMEEKTILKCISCNKRAKAGWWVSEWVSVCEWVCEWVSEWVCTIGASNGTDTPISWGWIMKCQLWVMNLDHAGDGTSTVICVFCWYLCCVLCSTATMLSAISVAHKISRRFVHFTKKNWQGRKVCTVFIISLCSRSHHFT
jgi:hypothetical protein